ncbi:hypothetical protein T09_10717 [Trichinella sp. T9]|nr:hypothetical protein T09_10717 [Trichinella sp. T9]
MKTLQFTIFPNGLKDCIYKIKYSLQLDYNSVTKGVTYIPKSRVELDPCDGSAICSPTEWNRPLSVPVRVLVFYRREVHVHLTGEQLEWACLEDQELKQDYLTENSPRLLFVQQRLPENLPQRLIGRTN